MSDAILTTFVRARALQICGRQRLHDGQRGEGVISAAMAVLIMAILGAAMWLTFDKLFDNTTKQTKTKVEQIGK